MRTSISARRVIVWLIALLIMSACAPTPGPTPTSVPTQPPVSDDMATTESDAEAGGPRTFVIDQERSSASYIVDEEFLPEMLTKYGIEPGRADTVGVTPDVEGRLTLDLADLSAPLGENTFQADLSKLESDQRLRDEWLQRRGPEFSTYPLAEFTATGVENAPEAYQEGESVQFELVGDLTIREITVPATFFVTASLEGDTISGTAVADLRLTDFGIEPPEFANTLTVEDEFQIQVDLVAVAE